jgi:hypothetical protein
MAGPLAWTQRDATAWWVGYEARKRGLATAAGSAAPAVTARERAADRT